MLKLVRLCTRLTELLVGAPIRALRSLLSLLVFNPRLGKFRILTGLATAYVLFGLILVYPFAFFWGLAGQAWLGKVLDYANERSLGTAVYDGQGQFVGIFDPVLDSEEDFNYTGRPIELPGYIAYPDHKSLHVSVIPEHYWQCLVHLEDRHLKSVLNPWGIDLAGYLKIPYSMAVRSIRSGRLEFGAGGSTIPMQLARIFFKTPPSRKEGKLGKIERKFKEWWLAPVIQRQLTRGGDLTPLKQWAANHFPLAQRTGGQPLYGVEQTSLIVFGKPAKELGRAEQYVLAAAVNQPIILLEGSEKLNRYRLASWQRVAGERAAVCARALVRDAGERAQLIAKLTRMAQSPPDPKIPDAIAETLREFAPATAGPASASPVRRANTLIPSARYGVRDEIRNSFGFGWRTRVRGVRITLDVAGNLALRERILDELARLQARYRSRINPRYSLDVEGVRRTGAGGEGGVTIPDIVIAAADRDGNILRYFESNYTAAYFGSPLARDPATGVYDPERETRFIASVAKMAAAVAIANEGSDRADTGYLDIAAPRTGLESCLKGRERRLRRADVAFACSLNGPIEWRLRQIRGGKLKRLVEDFSLALPEAGPPLAKALTVGQIAASPRTVHHMAGTILNALEGGAGEARPFPYPSLVQQIHLDAAPPPPGARSAAGEERVLAGAGAPPRNPVRPEGRELLRALLSAPVCNRYGTLRRLSDWCADRRESVRLHFAKTGTRGTGARAPEADDTVDLWVAGGIGFASGPAYSYVILMGTGNPNTPWARDLYAGSVLEPLARLLLEDLERVAAQKSASGPRQGAEATDRGVRLR